MNSQIRFSGNVINRGKMPHALTSAGKKFYFAVGIVKQVVITSERLLTWIKRNPDLILSENRVVGDKKVVSAPPSKSEMSKANKKAEEEAEEDVKKAEEPENRFSLQ